MKNEQLNNLVMEYKETQNEAIFAELYTEIKSQLAKRSWSSFIATVAKSLNADKHDVEEIYDEEILKAINVYDGRANFINFLKHNLWIARAGLLRRLKTRSKYEVQEINERNDDNTKAATFEIFVDDFDLEREAFKKEEADQRQLIDFLVRNSDATTTAIVEAFPRYKSITALGKALGLHHEVVKRKLRKLASNFDPQLFGDYKDYLFAH